MDFDVIIVGGRPAGATLAARLGARGHRVLLLERARFPSLPAVPSSPIVHAGTMALLDELGVDEAGYAEEQARMRVLRLAMAGAFETSMRLRPMAGGRDYTVGVARTTFDALLFRHLERFPSVTWREGVRVTDLVRDADRVIGVVAEDEAGATTPFTARAVVGADGRFSLVARKAGAEVVEEDAEHTSTVYYADWVGVRPVHDAGPAAFIYATARGLDVLMFAMPGGRWSVNTHARSDRVRVDGDARRYYEDTLRAAPPVKRLLEGAEQVSPVTGIKKIGNGYRRPSGPGWVLVGDAVHYKDPVDGQGIYDALLGAKLLDVELARFLAGDAPWEAAMASYRERLWEATHPMFLTTIGRLTRELYDEPPTAVIHTLIRWTLTDPGYQDTFLRVLGRDLAPGELTSRRTVAGAVARGIGRDLWRWLGGARAT